MYLVGLHMYYKMIYGPYNIKFLWLESFTSLLFESSEKCDATLLIKGLFSDKPYLISDHIASKRRNNKFMNNFAKNTNNERNLNMLLHALQNTHFKIYGTLATD